jgi:hypothetical protein
MQPHVHRFDTNGLGHVANQLEHGIVVHSPSIMVGDELLIREMLVCWTLEVGGRQYLFDLEASLHDHTWELVGFDDLHQCVQHGVVFRCTHRAGLLVPGVVGEYIELDEHGARLELHLATAYGAVIEGAGAKLRCCEAFACFSGE